MKTIVIKGKAARPSGRPDERTIIYPECGSPYYIASDGLPVFLSPPGTPRITSEDVRRELEDFP